MTITQMELLALLGIAVVLATYSAFLRKTISLSLNGPERKQDQKYRVYALMTGGLAIGFMLLVASFSKSSTESIIFSSYQAVYNSWNPAGNEPASGTIHLPFGYYQSVANDSLDFVINQSGYLAGTAKLGDEHDEYVVTYSGPVTYTNQLYELSVDAKVMNTVTNESFLARFHITEDQAGNKFELETEDTTIVHLDNAWVTITLDDKVLFNKKIPFRRVALSHYNQDYVELLAGQYYAEQDGFNLSLTGDGRFSGTHKDCEVEGKIALHWVHPGDAFPVSLVRTNCSGEQSHFVDGNYQGMGIIHIDSRGMHQLKMIFTLESDAELITNMVVIRGQDRL